MGTIWVLWLHIYKPYHSLDFYEAPPAMQLQWSWFKNQVSDRGGDRMGYLFSFTDVTPCLWIPQWTMQHKMCMEVMFMEVQLTWSRPFLHLMSTILLNFLFSRELGCGHFSGWPASSSILGLYILYLYWKFRPAKIGFHPSKETPCLTSCSVFPEVTPLGFHPS